MTCQEGRNTDWAVQQVPDGCSGVVGEDLVHLGHHRPLDDVHLLHLLGHHQAVRPASPSVVNAIRVVGCGNLAHGNRVRQSSASCCTNMMTGLLVLLAKSCYNMHLAVLDSYSHQGYQHQVVARLGWVARWLSLHWPEEGMLHCTKDCCVHLYSRQAWYWIFTKTAKAQPEDCVCRLEW